MPSSVATPPWWASVAGLLATFVALCATQSAQPALLYLVPSTLGVTVLVAWRRGELAKVGWPDVGSVDSPALALLTVRPRPGWAWHRSGCGRQLWNGDIVTDDDLVSEQQRLGSLLAAQDDDFFEGSDQEDDML